MEAFFDDFGRPKVRLIVAGSRGQATVEALLDTGFDGAVCLPLHIATQLGLELVSTQSVEYADGRVEKELVFWGAIVTDKGTEKVEITLTDSDEALAGLELFEDAVLTLDFKTRTVEVQR